MALTPPLQPITPIPTQRDAQGYSEASIRMLREYAQALQKQKYQPPNVKYPFYGIANGLDDASAKIMGGLAARQADEQERQRLNINADIDARHAGALGNQSAASPAGVGGPGTAAPFTQGTQVGLGPSLDKDSSSQPTRMAALETGAKSDTDLDPQFIESQKKLEGFSGKSYPDGKQHSVGYGTKARFEGELLNKNQADSRLQDELYKATKTVDDFGVPMTKGQREALTSLTFNTGSKWTNSGLGQAVKSGDWNTATQLLQQYNHAGGKVDPGLVSRRAAEAHAMAGGPDIGLTADLVDYHRTKTNTAAQLAQNSPPRMAPGAYQSDIADYIRERGGRGQTPFDPSDILNLRAKTQPQFQVGPYGQVQRDAPGEVPSITGMVPGFPGVIKKSDVTGTDVQEQYDPKTSGITQKVIIPTVPTVPTLSPQTQAPGQTTPPVPRPSVAPTGATVQAPAVPVPTPRPASASPVGAPAGGPLATVPPQTPVAVGTPPKAPISDVPGIATKPGQQLALADTAGVIPAERVIRNNLTQLAQSQLQTKPQSFEMPTYDLDNPKSSEEKNALKELDYADTHPVKPPSMPNLKTEGLSRAQDPNTPPLERLDALGNIKPLTEVHKAALEDQIKTQNKGFAELQKNYRDSQAQAVKLAPELKVAGKLLDSPDFHPGPASKLVENVRGLQEEAQSLFKTWAADGKARNEELVKQGKQPDSDPSVWERAAELIKPGHGATANQVYSKILSGSILQSLRGMLGPNAGQFRVQELRMLEQAFGNPNITLGANKTVMSMVDKINDRHILLGQMADSYLQKHKVLDPAFEAAVTRFEQRNPVFTPDEYKELLHTSVTGKSTTESGPATPTGGGPLGTAPPVPPKKEYKLPPGFRLE